MAIIWDTHQHLPTISQPIWPGSEHLNKPIPCQPALVAWPIHQEDHQCLRRNWRTKWRTISGITSTSGVILNHQAVPSMVINYLPTNITTDAPALPPGAMARPRKLLSLHPGGAPRVQGPIWANNCRPPGWAMTTACSIQSWSVVTPSHWCFLEAKNDHHLEWA